MVEDLKLPKKAYISLTGIEIIISSPGLDDQT